MGRRLSLSKHEIVGGLANCWLFLECLRNAIRDSQGNSRFSSNTYRYLAVTVGIVATFVGNRQRLLAADDQWSLPD